jgi:uncharacterized protein (UPF0548 family)
MLLTQLSGEAAAQLRAAEFTYPEIGGTAHALPAGYRHLHRTALLGNGQHVFTKAAAELMNWQAHLRAGVGVSASGPATAVGTNVLLHTRIGLVRLTAPCRVVYVIDEPDRRGFAYGTLVGHPESGEEAFTVSRTDDDVTFTITAFSRPATWPARVAGPLGRHVQDTITRRYLQSLRPSL